ncbi:MAG: hypothetical protein WKG00_05550 [Polyangiaceae bacterium]
MWALPLRTWSLAGRLERIKNIAAGSPVIDLMALAWAPVSISPAQFVRSSTVVEPRGPVVEEFTLILQTLNLGRTRKMH